MVVVLVSVTEIVVEACVCATGGVPGNAYKLAGMPMTGSAVVVDIGRGRDCAKHRAPVLEKPHAAVRNTLRNTLQNISINFMTKRKIAYGLKGPEASCVR